mmetsp:Transcript_38729/g.32701  ORF Transcript_38729/g.32701 Transcript_38729/m.32701 type:complete len:127 (+) Transcript_38729:1991-2371(+)
MVSKMPGVYAGDLRRVKSEYNHNFKKLLQYRDCIVFSQKKDGRPLFSKLANADLDGDHYQLIWDEDLIIDRPNAEPCPVPSKAITKGNEVKKRYAENVLKKNFLASSDMEFLGLIGDHLIQIADLN